MFGWRLELIAATSQSRCSCSGFPGVRDSVAQSLAASLLPMSLSIGHSGVA